ncbi:TetR/AcrR family transcriptional regulator [Salinibacterium soli]|uniref:TetR/AcrR family transcriptional regulator n=1 Tax=Antiquaquibacter soli TaxID=3064523 RepID=A0ABT9BRJ4_9MICO|nr:TetR/AcrR family transcriptional regulator [Protaetiibacter sp. WY-16]MDO7883641.1 TetR/AcrR family transcriptional regulator [Protaetiibacter sp. WY-16]
MTTRAESAARTRRELLAAAGALLDEGGPEAVTLRAVGAAAGVSRGAPYGHFVDKGELLASVAIESWSALTAALRELQEDSRLAPVDRLRRSLHLLLDLARGRPHRYAIMFVAPERNPEALLGAAAETQDAFLDIVADVVGSADARRSAALLMASTHGVASMEANGQLDGEKWGTSAPELVDELIDLVGGRAS